MEKPALSLSVSNWHCLYCRILGGSGLGLQYNLPTVKLSLFYEREIPPDCDEYIDGVCQISNGTERKFTINRGTGACTAQFNSIQLKNMRRPDRGKNEELVTEHKYAFVFYSTVQVCAEQIPVRVSRRRNQSLGHCADSSWAFGNCLEGGGCLEGVWGSAPQPATHVYRLLFLIEDLF